MTWEYVFIYYVIGWAYTLGKYEYLDSVFASWVGVPYWQALAYRWVIAFLWPVFVVFVFTLWVRSKWS